MINLRSDLLDGNWEQVSMIFEAANWGKRPSRDIQKAFANSTASIYAYDEIRLVGFGRLVSDGVYYGSLYDIIVHPEYQKRGIGTMIVDKLISYCSSLLFLTLTATPGKSTFYEKLGFKKQNSGMLLPRNDKQQNLYCE
jgi:aralkylamine N-acetyltransferase